MQTWEIGPWSHFHAIRPQHESFHPGEDGGAVSSMVQSVPHTGNKEEWLLWKEAIQECTEGTAGAVWEPHTGWDPVLL